MAVGHESRFHGVSHRLPLSAFHNDWGRNALE